MPIPHSLLPFEQAVARFHDGTLTPRAYLDSIIEATDLQNDLIQAFATLDLARAKHEADAATQRYADQAPRSAIDGMPIAIKDIIHTSHFPTGMGSPLYRGWQPQSNALAVDALIEAGAIILGKTYTTEFAIGRATITKNPHDFRRTPGGSSSGTAAAIGAGMICAGLGTQTQGSIIRPSSYCGVFGYKPTWGVLPLDGVHPVSHSHDHLGVIANSIDTIWALAYCIADWMPGGIKRRLADAHPTLQSQHAPLRKIAVLRTAGYDELSANEQRVFELAIDRFAAAGLMPVWPAQDADLAAFCAMLDTVPADSAEMVSRDMIWPYASYCQRDDADLSEKISTMVKRGRSVCAERYQALLSRRGTLLHHLTALAQQYDLFVLPSASGVAPMGHENTGSRTLAVYGSYLGVPAVSLPLLNVGNLPLGIQLLGTPQNDYTLLCQAKYLSTLFTKNEQS